MSNTQRYWDGTVWTENVAPTGVESSSAAKTDQQSQILVVAILAASVIGVIMSMQSASLLTGSGTQWTGAIIAIAAGCSAFLLRKAIPVWARVIAVLAALAAALGSVLYLENQLDERRQEFSQLGS